MRVRRVEKKIEMTWSYGTLQEAESLSGRWNNVTNAASPYRVDTDLQQKFVRTRN